MLNKCPSSLRVHHTLPLKNTHHSLLPLALKSSISSIQLTVLASICKPTSMAEQQQQQQQHQHQEAYQRPTDAFRSILPEKRPSTSQVLAVLTLLPIAGFLLFLAGIAFTGTVIGLAVSSPLWVIFSPILVPAALVIAVAVAGFLTSGAFGVTALSSLSWMANTLRRSRVTEQLEQAKRWLRETAGQAAQKAKEAGLTIQSKAQDGGMSEEGAQAQEGGRSEEVGLAQDGGRSEEGGRAQEGGRIEEGERAQEGGGAQEQGSPTDEGRALEGDEAQEGAKAQEGGRAQEEGKARGGGKSQGGGKAREGEKT